MSKTPLQLYINERYNDAVSDYVNKDWYHQDVSRKQRNSYNRRQPTFKQLLHTYTNSDFYFGSQTIFKNYLREHKKSIEQYYNLQKQQKEILHLCKDKIAKKFPAQLVANFRDEDVIRALKIAQNSNSSQMEKCCSSDIIVDAILKFITFNEEQKQIKKESSAKYKLRQTDSNSKNAMKGSTGLKKIFGVFKKKHPAENIVEKQECNYVVNSKEEDKTKSPKVAIDSGTTGSSNTSKTKINSKSDPLKTIYKREALRVANSTPVYQTDTKGKCTCHSRVKKLTEDIRKQKNQIKEIQITLEDCLAILKRIEDYPGVVYKQDFINNSVPDTEYDLNTYPRSEYQYRVEHTSGSAKKQKKCCRGSDKSQKSDTSSEGEPKRTCCYKYKRKQPLRDKTISVSPEKHAATTSTSQGIVEPPATPKQSLTPKPPPTPEQSLTPKPPPTPKQLHTPQPPPIPEQSLTTKPPLVQQLHDDADDESHEVPLTKKEKRVIEKRRHKQRKVEKSELRRETKKQKHMNKGSAKKTSAKKSGPKKKRCCLIRLIKYVCCSGCCA